MKAGGDMVKDWVKVIAPTHLRYWLVSYSCILP